MVMSLRCAINFNTQTYFPVSFSKPLLKLSMNRFIQVFFLGWPCVFFRIMAQSTGVSVRATTPEMIIELAIVIENWR